MTKGRRPKEPAPGESKDVNVTLNDELSLDLWAFCEAHYGASQQRVICEALRHFIDGRLESEANVRLRFQEAKARAQSRMAAVFSLSDRRPVEGNK
jgi:hypothetical protein